MFRVTRGAATSEDYPSEMQETTVEYSARAPGTIGGMHPNIRT